MVDAPRRLLAENPARDPRFKVVDCWVECANFADDDPDSTLIISFSPEDEDGRIDLVHLDVPENDFQGVSGGWESRYFAPWLTYLQGGDS